MTRSSIPTGQPSRLALGVVRGVSYGLFRKPDPCVKQARDLGATLVRIYLYWSQIEPGPGRYTFEVVDHFLDQLDGSEDVWITICSSSTWATQQATTFFPPSPAKDAETYRRFVHLLVSHCRGRVNYWQCDNEPSNIGLTWQGTADEYVAQLRIMHQAVKAADPGAAVVLGGAPYGLPESAPDSADRQFFDVLLRDARDVFDLFDLHLYADPDRIPGDIEMVRGLMRAFGYEKPVVIGEYGSPTPEAFPRAQAALHEIMAAVFGAAAGSAVEDTKSDVTSAQGKGPDSPPTTPERRAMAALYARMPTLPPELQMFMSGCSAELEAKRARINAREIVIRNLQALSSGVKLTACWKLAPEVANYEDPLSMMDLFYGKLLLLDYEDGEIRRRYLAGKTFALLAEQLRDLDSVTRIDVPEEPRVRMFDVRRRGKENLLVVWRTGDAFSGEDEPPMRLARRWAEKGAMVVDAFGVAQPAVVREGHVMLSVSITPVFVVAAAVARGPAGLEEQSEGASRA